MRHQKKHGMKLGTDASHTKAIKRSLVCALLENDRIKTTLNRAKAIRSDFDHIVTLAKRGDLHARRQAIALTNNKELVREAFEKAAQGMWADRNGGYTRIYKLGPRKGDNAEMAIIEVCMEPVGSNKKEAKPTAVKPAAKTSAKAAVKPAASSKKSTSKDSAAKEAKEDETKADSRDAKKKAPASSKVSTTKKAETKPAAKKPAAKKATTASKTSSAKKPTAKKAPTKKDAE